MIPDVLAIAGCGAAKEKRADEWKDALVVGADRRGDEDLR